MCKKWKVSDFVLIGLLAAVHAAVIYGVGMLTAIMIPIMHVFATSITALIMGSIILFVVKKTEKFGAFTLLVSLGTALFTLTGMGSITCLIFVVIVSFVADIIIFKTKFNTLAIGIGFGFSQAAYFHFLFGKRSTGLDGNGIRRRGNLWLCKILYRWICSIRYNQLNYMWNHWSLYRKNNIEKAF